MIDSYNWSSKAKAKTLQEDAVGKVISQVVLLDNHLHIIFEDGSELNFYDDGQSCCEYRYFTSDGDDLSEFIGAKYVEAFLKDAPNVEEVYDVHEVCFLEVRTSRGSITVSAHNEHDGGYGGFGITVSGD